MRFCFFEKHLKKKKKKKRRTRLWLARYKAKPNDESLYPNTDCLGEEFSESRENSLKNTGVQTLRKLNVFQVLIASHPSYVEGSASCDTFYKYIIYYNMYAIYTNVLEISQV